VETRQKLGVFTHPRRWRRGRRRYNPAMTTTSIPASLSAPALPSSTGLSGLTDLDHGALPARRPRHHRRPGRRPAGTDRRPDPTQGPHRPRRALHPPLEALAHTSSKDLGL